MTNVELRKWILLFLLSCTLWIKPGKALLTLIKNILHRLTQPSTIIPAKDDTLGLDAFMPFWVRFVAGIQI